MKQIKDIFLQVQCAGISHMCFFNKIENENLRVIIKNLTISEAHQRLDISFIAYKYFLRWEINSKIKLKRK